MKLKPGMYIRTKNGIAKIINTSFSNEYVDDALVVDKELEFGFVGSNDEFLCDKKNVIKASNNIINIIEVGDYVNGYQVVEKPYIYQNIEFVSVDTQDSWSWGKGEMPCTEIKTILTKEQFENNCYEIGDE